MEGVNKNLKVNLDYTYFKKTTLFISFIPFARGTKLLSSFVRKHRSYVVSYLTLKNIIKTVFGGISSIGYF